MLKNKITNGIYIGQTKNPKRRLWEHKSRSRNIKYSQEKLYKAIRQYGIDNFEMEILEEVPYELKDMKEEYYINKLNALSDENYNEIQGNNLLKDLNKNLIVQDYLDGLSATKIGNKYGVKHPQIITILKAELGDDKYKELSKKHTPNKKNIPIETIVDLIENQGKSKKETAEILGVCDSTIVRRYNKWKKSQDNTYVVNPTGLGNKQVDVNLIVSTYKQTKSTRKTAKITTYSRSTVRRYLKKEGIL